MALSFKGAGEPMSDAGMAAAAKRIGVKLPEVWAVLTVETTGCGFLPDRRPKILFERHIFSRRSKRKFDQQAPEVSNRKAGGYKGGKAEYPRLAKAMKLDRAAGLESASWGIGQVMGFNAKAVGFDSAEAMVKAMTESEDAQLDAMIGFIAANKLDGPMRKKDWRAFARGYNGKAFAKNQYDTRLAAAHAKYSKGPMPDLTLRGAQIMLTYIGLDPGPVDGLWGRRTRGALNDFRAANGLPGGDALSQKLLKTLRERALG